MRMIRVVVFGGRWCKVVERRRDGGSMEAVRERWRSTARWGVGKFRERWFFCRNASTQERPVVVVIVAGGSGRRTSYSERWVWGRL